MRNVLILLSMMFSIIALGSPLCLYSYGTHKKELSLIYTALQTHVDKKEITLELTQKSIIQFMKIIDSRQFLILKEEVEHFQNLSNQELSDIRSELISQPTSNFYLSSQKMVRERFQSLYFLVNSKKPLRDEIEKRIELYNNNPELIPDIQVPPENHQESLSKRQDQIALTAVFHIRNSKQKLSTRQALVMGLRSFRNETLDDFYAYQNDMQAAIIAKSFIDSLDAHSGLLLGKENQSFQQLFIPNQARIGAVLSLNMKGLEIQEVLPGSGSEKAGLKKGDIITHIKMTPEQKELFIDPMNQKSEWIPIRALNQNSLINSVIAGKEHTNLEVRILRDGKIFNTKVQRFTMSKGDTEIHSKIFPSSNGNIAYIKLDRFYSESAEEIYQTIKDAKKKSSKALILDLRQNGGGSVHAYVKILGFFVKNGPALVKSNHNYSEVIDIIETTNHPHLMWDRPLFVLVDKASASASEGLTGALKDYGRAIIIGADKSTYGKGSMQSVNIVNSLSTIKVTETLFASPSGGHKQFDGVTPDIVIPTKSEIDFPSEKELPNAIKPLSSFLALNEQNAFIQNKEQVVRQLRTKLKGYERLEQIPLTEDDLLNKALYLMNSWLDSKN